MTRIVLIADDLTGANDAGVQFVRHGFQASVIFAGQPVQAGTEVLVVDTDTRGRPTEAAYALTRQAADQLAQLMPRLVYKKVDSTLRGNLAAEIDAVLDSFGLRLALIAPAFPRIGRTTLDGVQYLNGTPVHETEIGRDPKAPVITADLNHLLAEGSKRQVGKLTLEDLRSGSADRRLVDLAAEGCALVICDATAEEDLRQVALAGARLGEPVLWVGSAGLADMLPEALGLRPNEGGAAAVEPGTGPVLLAVGSVSSVSRGQLTTVLAQPGVLGVALDAEQVVTGDVAAAAEEERCAALALEALLAGTDVALFSTIAGNSVARTQQRGLAVGLSPVQSAERVAQSLGRVAGLLCRKAAIGGLVLTGGDTAQAVCRAIGATGIELIREVEPGIPLGRLVGGRSYLAVTKAGAFGTEQALQKAVVSIKGGDPS